MQTSSFDHNYCLGCQNLVVTNSTVTCTCNSGEYLGNFIIKSLYIRFLIYMHIYSKSRCVWWYISCSNMHTMCIRLIPKFRFINMYSMSRSSKNGSCGNIPTYKHGIQRISRKIIFSSNNFVIYLTMWSLIMHLAW